MFPQAFLSQSTVLTISLTSSNSYNPQTNLVNLALPFNQILQTWTLWLREVPKITQRGEAAEFELRQSDARAVKVRPLNGPASIYQFS